MMIEARHYVFGSSARGPGEGDRAWEGVSAPFLHNLRADFYAINQ
jgi:hypothetical protein